LFASVGILKHCKQINTKKQTKTTAYKSLQSVGYFQHIYITATVTDGIFKLTTTRVGYLQADTFTTCRVTQVKLDNRQYTGIKFNMDYGIS